MRPLIVLCFILAAMAEEAAPKEITPEESARVLAELKAAREAKAPPAHGRAADAPFVSGSAAEALRAAEDYRKAKLAEEAYFPAHGTPVDGNGKPVPEADPKGMAIRAETERAKRAFELACAPLGASSSPESRAIALKAAQATRQAAADAAEKAFADAVIPLALAVPLVPEIADPRQSEVAEAQRRKTHNATVLRFRALLLSEGPDRFVASAAEQLLATIPAQSR